MKLNYFKCSKYRFPILFYNQLSLLFLGVILQGCTSSWQESNVNGIPAWHRGTVTLYDRNNDGVVDEKVIEVDQDHGLMYLDTNYDGYYDEFFLIVIGGVDRNSKKNIHEPVDPTPINK